MVEPYLRRSPLAHKSLAARATEAHPDAGVRLGESPHRCQIDLRGNPADPAFLGAVAGVIGGELPTTPNRTAAGNGLSALWLGPDEWLIVGPPGREATRRATTSTSPTASPTISGTGSSAPRRSTGWR
jgi:sarcosine oxidase, subunit gamma